MGELTAYRLLRGLYVWAPLPPRVKRVLATRFLDGVPALRRAGLLARAGISANHTIRLLSETMAAPGGPPGLGQPPRKRALMIVPNVSDGNRLCLDDRETAILDHLRDQEWDITVAVLPKPGSIDRRSRCRTGNTDGTEIVNGSAGLTMHLAAEGGSYGCAIATRQGLMFEVAPILRALTPNAQLVYMASVPNDAGAGQDNRMERANIAAADLVIAASSQHRASILELNLQATVISVPTDMLDAENRTGIAEFSDMLTGVDRPRHHDWSLP